MTMEDEATAETSENPSSTSWFKSIRDQTESFPPCDVLPPWLARHESPRNQGSLTQKVQWLECALLERNFSALDIGDVIYTVQMVTANDATNASGVLDFLLLLLQVEEEPSSDRAFVVSKDLLIASILHYTDCVTARQSGLYELVKQACNPQSKFIPEQDRQLPVCGNNVLEEDSEAADNHLDSSSSAIQLRQDSKAEMLYTKSPNREGVTALYEEVNDEVLKIANGAARIKQVEILAHAVLGEVGRTLSLEEASRLRGLLLSVTDDWRALAIRSTAALYRLEGLFHEGTSEYLRKTPEMIQTARNALRVYAPLAQRLGMNRLKAKLEALAFRILYRRQYEAVNLMYQEIGSVQDAKEAMHSISTYLMKHISHILTQDQTLMGELESLSVTTRVKEPYSLWKKLLKTRTKQKISQQERPALTIRDKDQDSMQSDLSVLEVLDAIALRVILKARKWTPDEEDYLTEAREKILCYYVQKKVLEYWPATETSRVKDYIREPKANGYQSLHYTSSIRCFGEIWPFEVQIRSEEMHRLAEYGVAAHWDYKLTGSTPRRIKPLPNEGEESVFSPSGSDLAIVPSADGRLGRIRLTDTDEQVDSYVDALITARDDLVQQKVFVFLSGSSTIEEGQLLSLPLGATVRDALVELEEHLQTRLDKHVEVFRNGMLAQLDDFVGTGDLIVIDS